jgi:hypothetical protein
MIISSKKTSQRTVTIRALAGIPVRLGGATGTTPPFVLLRNPGIYADLFLTANILQYFRVMGKTIVIETCHELAGGIGALGAACQSLCKRAIAYLALAARYGNNFGKAPFAGQIIRLNLMIKVKADAIRHRLKHQLIFTIVCSPYGTGATIETAGCSELLLILHTTPLSESKSLTAISAQSGKCRKHSDWP